MNVDTLQDFYLEELRVLYNAENQILKVYPRMANSANSPALRKAFEDHIDETRIHVTRLETIFEGLGTDPNGEECRAMEAILAEAEAVFLGDMPDAVKDAALIAAAQRVEHYEIAGYGCVRTYAEVLGDAQSMERLNETLQDEGDADKRLTEIAMGEVNERATAGSTDF